MHLHMTTAKIMTSFLMRGQVSSIIFAIMNNVVDQIKASHALKE